MDDLAFVLQASAAAPECASVRAWWPLQAGLQRESRSAFTCAVAGGYAADRLAWAFCSGYQAALHALLPELPPDTLASFCVSEAGGNHPRAITTTLTGDATGRLRLDGGKRWTTLGPESAMLLVAARAGVGDDGQRIALKLVRVRSDAPGVTILPMPGIAFVPEVAHAELRFAAVDIAPEDVLAGDAYARYVKPFRTLEDLHVHAATLAYLMREAARLDWPRAWRERAYCALHALAAIAALDPGAARTHIALAGALDLGMNLVREAEIFWEAARGDRAHERWQRDRALLEIAGKVRTLRTERAWEHLAAG